MAIEVVEMGPDHWNVYFSREKDEACCCSCNSEWLGCGEIVCYFPNQAMANRLADYLRSAPGGYEAAVNHWTTVLDDPWVRACGCHEDERHWWIAECAFVQQLERIWAEGEAVREQAVSGG